VFVRPAKSREIGLPENMARFAHTDANWLTLANGLGANM
jgi:hypothetical protein